MDRFFNEAGNRNPGLLHNKFYVDAGSAGGRDGMVIETWQISIHVAAVFDSGNVCDDWFAVLITKDDSNLPNPHSQMTFPFTFELFNVGGIPFLE